MIAILLFFAQSKSQRNLNLSKVEVYLDEQQINNLQSILLQSEFGIHILFENSLITDVFKQPYSEEKFFEIENIKKIQDDILKLLQFKTINDKRNFIKSLPPEDQRRIVRAYFYIVENNLRVNQKLPH